MSWQANWYRRRSLGCVRCQGGGREGPAASPLSARRRARGSVRSAIRQDIHTEYQKRGRGFRAEGQGKDPFVRCLIPVLLPFRILVISVAPFRGPLRVYCVLPIRRLRLRVLAAVLVSEAGVICSLEGESRVELVIVAGVGHLLGV